jgi:hypothetical protein
MSVDKITFVSSTLDINAEMDETGISWKSDRDEKFKNPDAADIDTSKYQYLYQSYPGIISEAAGEYSLCL